MKTLLQKYLQKLLERKLVNPEEVFFACREDRFWIEGRFSEDKRAELLRVFDHLRINSLLWAEPQGVWRECLRISLQDNITERVVPQDCETRTFFHHFPVVRELDFRLLSGALAETKAVLIREPLSIISKATVSPEQAFVAYSSACFSLFVKTFYDILQKSQRQGPITGKDLEDFLCLWKGVPEVKTSIDDLAIPEDILRAKEALIKVGKDIVKGGLVDSYFGNLSLRVDDTMLISLTAASLDELEDALEEVPIKGSSTVALVASSEMPTHLRVYQRTPYRVILHGHPRFSVIMSMYCESPCEFEGRCHLCCPEDRSMFGAKLVPGEIGTGRFAIVNTVPQALQDSDAAVVISHGVFTAHEESISEALKRMVEIERCAKLRYYRTVTGRELEDSESRPCPD